MYKLKINENIPNDTPPSNLIGYIWYYLKPAKYPLLIIFLLEIIAMTIFSLSPLFYREIVTLINNNGNQDDLIKIFFWMILVLFIIQPFFARAAGLLGWPMLFSVLRENIRYTMTVQTKRQDLKFFEREYAGRLASKIKEGSFAIVEIASISVFTFAGFFVSFIVTAILLFKVNLYFTIILISWAAVYIFLISKNIKSFSSISQKSSENHSRTFGVIVDILSNIRLVKSIGSSSSEDKIMAGYSFNSADASKKFHMNLQVFWVKLSILTIFLGAPILILTAFGLKNGTLTSADAVMVITLLPQFIGLAWMSTDSILNFCLQVSNVIDTKKALNKPIEIFDQDNAIVLPKKAGKIEFKNVTFQHGEIKALQDLSLIVKAGEHLGITGRSGMGKSTLLDLVIRLRDPQKGDIIVNDYNVKDVKLESIRECISLVSQQGSLLHRSVRENIKYGKTHATDLEMEEAAKLAGAHEFIIKLIDNQGRKGYDAYVGEKGVTLSGGQRQKISIACALLKDAPILLMDEATSALDGESEYVIQNGLLKIMEGKTVIIVAHRLSTLMRMDRIIVLDEGKIVEEGSHDNLILKNGHYSHLWNRQSKN